MNMHPGDLRSIEDSRGADSAQKEETSPINSPHVSEVTKTQIHIEAGVNFLVGILISRFRRFFFLCFWRGLCNRNFRIRGFIVRVQVNWPWTRR